MKMLLTFLDGVLAGLRESRVSVLPSERMNLAPVWVMPMPNRLETR